MELVRSGTSWSGRERNCVFLNCPDQTKHDGVNAKLPATTFANAANVSGMDLPDDARAVAVVDWDHDGDQDIWIRNRTAPRMRLFLNRSRDLNPQASSVEIRLVGTDCNRDAIGANVELEFDQPQKRRFIASVTAGDAFLSQSSRWLHFGLGANSSTIKQVRVQWPGGAEEVFVGVNNGGRYTLTQGDGVTEHRQRQVPRMMVQEATLPETTAAARIVFPGKLPFPNLDVLDAVTASSPSNGAVLVTLWSSECPNCRSLLKTFSDSLKAFQEANLDLIAVCVDQVDGTANGASSDYLREIPFPFRTAAATLDTVQTLQDYRRSLFDMYPDSIVPISFLLSSKRDLVAIYRGVVQPDILLKDVHLTNMNNAQLRDHAVPFKGSWFTKPATDAEIVEIIGKRFFKRNPGQGLRFFEQAINQATDPQVKKKLSQGVVNTHVSLARAASGKDEFQSACDHFEAALQYASESAQLHHEFGQMLTQGGRYDAAELHLREALRLRPDSATAKRSLQALLRKKAESALPPN